MESGDRKEFEAQLAILCAGYDKPVGDRAEAYWKGLTKMSLIEFARCVEHAVGDEGPDKFPTVHVVRQILRDLKTRHRSVTVPAQREDSRDHLLFYANRMFLRHVVTRGGLGSTSRFTPGYGLVDVEASAELIAARRFVRELVDWWSGPIREGDRDATQAEFIRQFATGLHKISPLAESARLEWDERQRDPRAQQPFPPSMGRVLEAKYDDVRPQPLVLTG